MDREELASRIDHTVLGPTTTATDVMATVDVAREHGMNACVPPCYLETARQAGGGALTLVTVVGFPHGQHATRSKVAEATAAVDAGADELDMVANVGRLLGDESELVGADIAGVVDAVEVPVKVIVEAGLLSRSRLQEVGSIARDSGADYLKTSTGVAGGPATTAAVGVLAEYLPVKASGGIGDYQTAAAMFEAGAQRIGASSGAAILADHRRRHA